MSKDQKAPIRPDAAPKRPIDAALAQRNRRTAGALLLLALASLLAFLANFGVFS